MPLTYLDQNALIDLGREARQAHFRKKLDVTIESGSITIVVSSWHLVETANTSNVKNAIELAQFIDSLNPHWLLDRRDIQRIEVAQQLFRFLKIDYQAAPRVTTRSAAHATLQGEPDSPKFDIPSERFVRQWIEHPEQLKVLQNAHKANAEALIGLRDATKAVKITDDLRKRTNEVLLRSCLPDRTPAGLALGHESILVCGVRPPAGHI